MNSEGGLVPTNLAEVMDKFNQSIRKFALKETEWLFQKGNFETRIAELEGHVKAHENINVDLLKRVKMLEYSLNQERIKNSKLLNNANEAEKEELKFNNNIILDDIEDKRQLIKEEDLKLMREKTIRPSLISMLNDIGINENLANNLFTDLELNKSELERLIKSNMDEKLNQILNNNENKENENIPKEDNTKNNIQPQFNNENVNNINFQQEQIEFNNKESISTNNEKVELKQQINYNLSLSRYIELKSHFDVIRKLGYLPNLNSLVSVSEDCLIKVWSLNNINYSNQSQDIEPYLILRGHTGPLFSLAVSPDNSNLLYTAGNEGIIKIWKIPRQDEVSQYGDTDMIFNCNVGFFQKQNEINEVVWDLKHHPTKKLLVSLNADATLCVWETASADDYIQALSEMKYDKWLKTKKSRGPIENSNELPIPTTCTFMNIDSNQLVCGFNDACLSVYDFNKNYFSSEIKTYKNEKMSSPIDHQPNCLVSSTSIPTIYGGFEDNTIKSFDMRIESVTNTITAHSDAVTSLNLFNDIYLFSTSHDTKIKMWDIRYLNAPLQETIGSQKKWDEAMWHSVLIPNQLLLATAGADSFVKIFKL